jgi:putative ABC transport system permease protein
MWSFYFRSAFRSISRKKLFTGLNVVGIAIGISVFLLSLQFYSYERGYNTFHDHLAQLYRVGTKGKDGRSLSTFPPLGPLLQNNIPGVHRAVRLAENFNDGAIISFQPDDKKQSLRSFREDGCVFADEAFLETFHFPLIAGSNRLDQANTVVLTSAAATRVFGNEQAVGKVIHLHNQFGDLSAKVVGVTADIPEQSDIRFQYLFSIHMLEDPAYTEGSDWAKLNNWGNDAYSTYVWLQPNANVAAVEASATALWRRNDPDYSRKSGSVFLQPVADLHLGRSWNDDTPSFGSYALTSTVLALGILILCIGWINYINFSTADALSRAKEIGIHKIVGSSRTQITWKAMTESIVINFFAILLACMLTQMLQGLFNYATKRPLSLVYIGSASYFVVALSILLAGSLACGLYTGLLLSRLKPITALHLNDAGKIGNAVLRKGLVVFQLTVACTFIAITMVAFRQISFMKHQNLGMKIDGLVVITGPAIKDSTFKSNSILFRTEVSRMPFIEKFTSSGSTPGTGSGHNFSSDGITGANQAPGDDHTEYSISIIDENFFPTYQIPLLYGGNFDRSDAAKGFKADRLIVNETAARSLGYSPEKAVGQTIRWGKNYMIAGVAHDYHHRSLKDPIEPII